MDSSSGSAWIPSEESGDVFADLIAPADPDEFFSKIWQKRPCVFSASDCAAQAGGSSSSSASVRRPLLQQTWTDCCDHLTLAWGLHPRLLPPDGSELLVFKGREITRQYDHTGPCAALLDGASCVVNHAEYIWPPLSKLCMRLRKCLCHVYVNTYITPPVSQAVRPHADDRDVFVLQLCGTKHWRVYGNPPIKLPYSDEQVGKGIPVPDQVLQSEPLMECELKPGDVLYMPRGFVHEACCPGNMSSWHATLAVATHDWSWSKVCSGALANAMDAENDARWRAAVPLSLGTPEGLLNRRQSVDEAEAEAALEELVKAMQAVTVQNLKEKFYSKLLTHNKNQEQAIHHFAQSIADFEENVPCSGPAQFDDQFYNWRINRHVDLDTRVRAGSTVEVDEAEVRHAQKGKGKGKGKDDSRPSSMLFPLRSELVDPANLVLKELRRKGTSGLAVADFANLVPEGELFDELAQLCLARTCLIVGNIRFPTTAFPTTAPSGAPPSGVRGDVDPLPVSEDCDSPVSAGYVADEAPAAPPPQTSSDLGQKFAGVMGFCKTQAAAWLSGGGARTSPTSVAQLE